jgi:hypothetical protein
MSTHLKKYIETQFLTFPHNPNSYSIFLNTPYVKTGAIFSLSQTHNGINGKSLFIAFTAKNDVTVSYKNNMQWHLALH